MSPTEVQRLLGDGAWADAHDGTWTASLPTDLAADLAARLRGLALSGHPVTVDVHPTLKRTVVRAARTEDARRRRDTTPGFTRPGARLDDEGRFSLTPETIALDVGRIIAQALGPDALVLDAGCGAGGNAIGLARAGLRVEAVERDPHRAELARHNAGIYGVDARVAVSVGDATDAIRDTTAAAVFVDPPWGEHSRGVSILGDLDPLGDWLATARERGLPVWAKVPPGFDPAGLDGVVPSAWFGRAPGDRRRIKFVLLALPGA